MSASSPKVLVGNRVIVADASKVFSITCDKNHINQWHIQVTSNEVVETVANYGRGPIEGKKYLYTTASFDTEQECLAEFALLQQQMKENRV
jgi:hypothetical protein